MTKDTLQAAPQGANGVALHRQIFLVLRDEIARGIVADGTLTNEEMLCKRFNVSRITVRRTLQDLAALGLVERRPGKGTVVRRRAASPQPEPSLEFVEGVRASSAQTSSTVLALGVDSPPLNVARLLKVGIDETALRIVRSRADESGRPALLTDVWIPKDLNAGMTKKTLSKKAAYEVLVENGVTIGRIVQIFSASVADPTRAELLQMDVGAPLLKMERLLHDSKDRPVLHLAAYLPADRGSVIMETSSDSINTLAGGQIFLEMAPTTNELS
jgi:GntR family transcriptional regulator